MELGDAYQGYSIKYSADSLAPLFTMKLGQIYEHILKDPNGASDYYKQSLMRYPNYAHRDEILFHLGNLYFDQKSPDAKIYFERLVTEYPRSIFRKDAIAFLKMADDTSLNATVHRFEKELEAKKANGGIQ
jgi:outer membrane protein assembly factor BamD (BamD/ComL family)